MSGDRTGDQVHSGGDDVEHADPKEGLLLEGVVSVSGTEKQLTLKHDCLVFGSQITGESAVKKKDLCLTWPDVICAVKDVQSKSGSQLDSFRLHYIHHQNNNTLQVQSLRVTTKNGEVDKWISGINEKCQKVSGRPKKAFVIINPIGGSKTALKTYQKKVAPLFELAGIHTTVQATERSKHALELGEHQDFSGYDVIVIVGGDGLYHEVLQGFTLRTQKEAEIDYDNPDAIYMKPKIPFAIIPAGTGNGLARYSNGTLNQVTAALNIIRGENHKAQVLTVHNCGKFVTLCGALFGYGSFSYATKRSEELRWMGRARYGYTIFAMLFRKSRRFNCSIEYRVADNDETQDLSHSSSAASAKKSEWIAYTSKDGNPSNFFCSTCEHILDKNQYILDPFGSSIDILMEFGAGLINFIKSMLTYSFGKNATQPLPEKVDMLTRITGFRIRLNSDATDVESHSRERVRDRELEHILNVDGEIVHVDIPDVDIRVCSEFVSLYGCRKVPGSTKDT
ncbi:hypothetical protein BsWGS_22439 [Bradybaena similaris]